MVKYFLAIIIVATSLVNIQTLHAQAICGNELIEQEIKKDAYLKAASDEYFKQYVNENRALSQNRAANKGTADNERYVIPVVFHIVVNQEQFDKLGKEAGVIERINSQLQAVNEDFAMTNADLSKVPAAFKNDIGNANIHFELAKRDANGNAKIGIDYKILDNSITGFDSHKADVKKSGTGLPPWDNTKFLNIWVTNINASGGSTGQVLGYGYNPHYADTRLNDPSLGGIVIHYLTFGKKTAAGQHYLPKNTLGRTLTHELGHFFNIWHIWGRTVSAGTKNCNEDDGIDDTPLQEESNFNCPGFTPNCPAKPHPGGEMYMNFMDYSGDSCVVMFSKGQVDRMRKELAFGGEVYSLSQSKHLAFWPSNVSKVEYNNEISIVPNPTTGKISLNFVKKFDALEAITVTNSLGQAIKNIAVTDQGNTSYPIDISSYPKGVYMLQLHFDQGVITRKVVLQ